MPEASSAARELIRCGCKLMYTGRKMQMKEGSRKMQMKEGGTKVYSFIFVQ